MPVHGFTETPVVSLPQESVIVFDSNGLSVIASKTGGNASIPIPCNRGKIYFVVFQVIMPLRCTLQLLAETKKYDLIL